MDRRGYSTGDGTSAEENSWISPTYALQISVNHIIVVQIIEAAGDPDQLHFSQYAVGILIVEVGRANSKRLTPGCLFTCSSMSP